MNESATPISNAALAIAGLEDQSWQHIDGRGRLRLVAQLGFRGVQIDGMNAAFRPRTLDRSARRDIAATLRRLELNFAGLDLFIPPEHFLDPTRCDHAVGATMQAADLASELATLTGGASHPVVSMRLADPAIDSSEVEAVCAHAARVGAVIADHRWPIAESKGMRGIGFDPVDALLDGKDPSTVIAPLVSSLRSVRVSDIGSVGRIAPGDDSGRLDLFEYLASLAALSYPGPLVVDLQQVRDQQDAADRVTARLRSIASRLTPG